MPLKFKKYLFFTLVSILLLALVLLCIWYLRIAFYNGSIRMNYPSFKTFPVQGIDISHHQGKIDWQQLDKKRVQFVFIKATEGGDFKDKRFQSYWRDAKKYGIAVGVYHFFTFCRSANEQAAHYISQVPKQVISLPPVVDLEFGGNCKQSRYTDLLDEIKQYIQTIETHYQRKVIIYTTQEFYQAYLIDQFLDNPLWIRDIYKEPHLPKNRPWLFWQFANRGHLAGIKGFVDLNVFAGSEAAFKTFINP